MASLLTKDERRWRRKARLITYERPWVYEKQAAFLFTPAIYSVVEATTKSGKTTGCCIWLNEKAALEGFVGWNGWWVAPIRAQAKIAYDRFKMWMAKFGDLFRFNDTELSVLYPNGAKLWFKSADHPDGLYGDDVYAAVFDEATRAKEAAWHALYSTLTFTEGQVRIIGNVRGSKNWAFKLARRAEGGEADMYHARLTAWDAVEAGILKREVVDRAQRMLPEVVFNELYLAIPSEDGSNPFGVGAIRKCMMEKLAPGPTVAHGVDLAKSFDWATDIGLNREKRMSFYDRWQGPWETTTSRVMRNVGTALATVDASGVGDPIVERLASGRSNYTGFKITGASRQPLLEGLAVAISERARDNDPWLWAGDNDVLKSELESFEYVVTPGGAVRYEVPEGMHDDTVFGLALALEQFRTLGRLPTRGARAVTF